VSDTLYLGLWAVYLVCTGLSFLLFWNLTRWPKLWRYLARFLRLLFLAVMLAPATLSTHPESMAPALIVAFFDYIQENQDGFYSALVNLMAALALSLIIFVIYIIIALIVHSRRKA